MARNNGEVIRFADRDDALALAQLHRVTVTTAYAHIFPSDSLPPTITELEADYAAQLRDPAAQVLVFDDSGVVGSIAVVADDTVPAGLRIERFNVHPDRQAVGIGSSLYRRALELASERGADWLNLWVLEGNDRARAIYESWGWVRVEGRTLPNGPPEVLDVLYELDLARGPGGRHEPGITS